jgi:hypothetical protein
MTNQTAIRKCLGGSPAGISIVRLCALTFAAILLTGGWAFGQTQPEAAKPDAAKTAPSAAEKKPVKAPGETIWHHYQVHQAMELGGRITSVSGSTPMWDTLYNQSAGMRVLNQSLELRSEDKRKTPFFDSLSTNSAGYGGDPIDVTRLYVSKGRIYDFVGSFRRDRNYFDDNQFANSLDPTSYAGHVELVQQPHTLHLYDTVRRNSDAQITLLPLSLVSFRAGFNHNTNEGPTLTTEHGSTTAQVFQWFRNSSDTYSGGVDLRIAKRTTLNYDQFIVVYKGDSSSSLPNATQPLYALAANEMYPVSAVTTPGVAATPAVMATMGMTLYSNTNCGNVAVTGGASTVPSSVQANVTNGVMSPFCKAATLDNHWVPIRSYFPTEQVRFSSHYWEKFVFNGRVAYSGGSTNLNGYNWTQYGYSATKPAYTVGTATWNTETLGSVVTGNGPGGRYATNKRANLNVDFGFVAELAKNVSLADTYSYVGYRTEGILNSQTVSYTLSSLATTLAAEPSLLTSLPAGGAPVSTVTTGSENPATPGSAQAGLPYAQNQQIAQNTLLASFIVSPQFKFSTGWRFKSRQIDYTSYTGFVQSRDMLWHENAGLLGAVLDPSRTVHVNVNFEATASSHANPTTLSNTFTREAPDISQHLKLRALIKPAKWFNLAATDNSYWAKNNDPLVNHRERNEDASFTAMLKPTETLSFDLSYAYDEVYSVTDSCFQFTAANGYPVPYGATNTGTCTAFNSPVTGGTVYLYFNNYYKAPSSFYQASVNYTPTKLILFNGGLRMNAIHGTADYLNPIQTPGSLQSRTLTPYADAEYKIAEQWAWHGNWSYDGYGETGHLNAVMNGVTANGLPSRNVHGSILTLGVKYAF